MTFRRTRCAHCKKHLDPERPGQIVHAECAADWTHAQSAKREREEAKKARMAAKVERAEIRRRKADLKTIHQLIAEADTAFMAWVRERDRQAGYACISSGQPLDWSGNQVDAGHFRSRGAASQIRYHPDNCHAQSKRENRYLAGNAVEYRIGLIDRIGIDRVEALEADNTPHKWHRDELIEIRDRYREKLRELKKQEA